MTKAFLEFGNKYGRLTVIAPTYKERVTRREKASWCSCECGKFCVVTNYDLRAARIISCGCYRDNNNTQRLTTHGMSKSPEYKVWQGMKGRCHNPSHIDYNQYGEKGVTVCDRWRDSFEAFLQDMGCRPSDSHTIERVNVYEGYYPENCIWLEREEQAANKRKERRKGGTHPQYEYRKEARARKARGEYKKGGRPRKIVDAT